MDEVRATVLNRVLMHVSANQWPDGMSPEQTFAGSREIPLRSRASSWGPVGSIISSSVGLIWESAKEYRAEVTENYWVVK